MSIRTLLAVIAACIVAACGKPAEDLAWKQEVPLQDGRILTVDRVSKLTGKRFPEGGNYDTYQSLTFTHPDTGERISWAPPEHTGPVMLDIDGANAYYVVEAHMISDYNDIDCPNPPYLVYRYADKQWKQIQIEDMPVRFVERNVQIRSMEDKEAVADGIVTRAELDAYFKEFPPAMQFRTINRNKIDANVHGCFPSVLIKLGRENEITEPVGVPTSAQGATK